MTAAGEASLLFPDLGLIVASILRYRLTAATKARNNELSEVLKALNGLDSTGRNKRLVDTAIDNGIRGVVISYKSIMCLRRGRGILEAKLLRFCHRRNAQLSGRTQATLL